MSNLKQIGLASMMYTQDYDEKYPYAYSSSPETPPDGIYWASGTTWFWPQLIYPYTKSIQVALCPSAPTIRTKEGKPTPYYGSYGANMLLMPGYNASNPYSAISLATVQSAASTYMIMDSGTYRTAPRYWQGVYGIDAPRPDFSYLPGTGPGSAANLTATGSFTSEIEQDFRSGRHFNGINMAFADGHAKWIKSDIAYTEAKKCVACTETSTQQSAWNPRAQ